MGQEIVYCYRCQTRLLGSDFDRGKAFRINNNSACEDCAKQILEDLPPADREALLARNKGPEPRRGSTAKIPVYRPQPDSSSNRVSSVTTRQYPKKRSSTLAVALGGGGAALVLLIVIAAVMSGGSPRPREASAPPAPARPAPPPVAPVAPPPRPRLQPRPPSPVKRIEEARQFLEEARAFAKSNPDDLPRQIERFQKAAFTADGTALAAEAKTALDRAKAKLRGYFSKDLAELRSKAIAAAESGDIVKAVEEIDRARGRHAAAEWTSEIHRLIRDIEPFADRAYPALKKKALDLADAGDPAEAKAILESIRDWQIPRLFDDLDRALAGTEKPAEAPPPPSKAAFDYVVYDDALRKGWVNHSWASDTDLAVKSPVHSGARAIAFTPQKPWAGLFLRTYESLSTVVYPAVTFSARRADPSVSFTVVFYDEHGDVIGKLVSFDRIGGQPPTDRWKTYVVPASRLNAAGRLVSALVIQASAPTSKPALFVDDVGFLKTIPGALAAAPVATGYRAEWGRAAALAALRNYEAAAALLAKTIDAEKDAAAKKEAEADLADLRAAAALFAEAQRAFARWPRGWNLDVLYADASGMAVRIDEPVRRSDADRAILRGEPKESVVPFGEILSGSLAAIALAAKAQPTEADRRAAAILSLLEGDVAAASAYMKELPPKYVEHGQAAVRKRVSDAKELAARRLLYDAETDFRGYDTRIASLEKYRTLLADHGKTDVVRRNRKAIGGRTAGGREYFFGTADLAGNGACRLREHAKGALAWTCGKDVTAPDEQLESYVEFAFSALPDTEYQGWAYVGACCAETFTFHLQATDLEGPDAANAEPGSNASVPVAHGIRFLKKFHIQHGGGPKQPEKWGWAELRLPRFATGGVKTVRLLASKKGFSVAYALVSADRKSPPAVPEARQMDARRPALSPEALATARVETGSILREVWEGINGNTLAALTGNARFMEKPSITSRPTSFEAPQEWANNYGTRMRGYVHPPTTGDYVFWIATDDAGGLWLSTDEDPRNKKRIAYTNTPVTNRNWTSNSAQKSKPIRLERGRRYYVEALQKEGTGSDWLAVGWQLPGSRMERPIPGFRLSPFLEGGGSFSVQVSAPQDRAVLDAGENIAIEAAVRGGGKILRVEAYQGGVRLGTLRGDSLKTTWRGAAPGTYAITVVATERGGRTAVSRPIRVRVGEETYLYRAINLNGSEVVVDDQPWKGRQAADYAAEGWGLERQDLPLAPPAGSDRSRMLRSSIASGKGTGVTLNAVPDGSYQVYLYVWEPEGTKTYDLSVNGKVVVTGRKSGAVGSWARLGPWKVDVTKGTIEVSARRGPAHFSGLEVWKLGSPPPAPKEPVRTGMIGGRGGSPFEEAPADRPFLVGFRVTQGTFTGKPHAKTVQPIFLKDGAGRDGDVHGTPSGNRTEILAKPGYAVGAVVGKGSERVNGFKVIFYRIAGNALNPADTYESPWVGGDWGDPEKRLDGEGAPVVGIHGRQGGDTDCFGLVYLK